MKRITLIFLLGFKMTISSKEIMKSDEGYTKEFVGLVELVYGKGYLSQGGPAEVKKMFVGIDIHGKKVLDIGSGLGGPAIEMAKLYEVDVLGLDPKQFMVDYANNLAEEQSALRGAVSFEKLLDLSTFKQLADNLFDVATSKEVILHIPVDQKRGYLKDILRVLKPGGKLVVKDWVKGNNYSEQTQRMIEMDGVAFNMITVEDYEMLLKDAGFINIQIINETDKYIKYTSQNVDHILEHKDEIIKRFGEKTYTEYALDGWRLQKLGFEEHEIGVVKILAERP